jgi:hypothetical protein
MLQDRQDSRQGTNWSRIPNRPFTRKGRLMTEFHKLLYERWLQVELQGIILLTFLLISQISRFWQLVVLKVQHFSKLMQCVCQCGMVLMMHVRMTQLPICVDDRNAIKVGERICVTSCYLTTKIPSALLVAVVWLQRTRYPRFRRGTFDHEVTTSPNKRGRGTEFHASAR